MSQTGSDEKTDTVFQEKSEKSENSENTKKHDQTSQKLNTPTLNLQQLTANVVISDMSEESSEENTPFCLNIKLKFKHLSLIPKLILALLAVIWIAVLTVIFWWAVNWHIAVIFPTIMILFFGCFSVYTVQCTRMYRDRHGSLEKDAMERVRRYHMRRSRQYSGN